MLKKEITFENLDEEKVTQTFYFHLSKPELIELEYSKPEGFEAFFRTVVANEDKATIIATIKDFIVRAYGERSSDGVRFIKSKELSDAFCQTDAYSELFMELVTNPVAGAEFMNALMPKGLVEQVQSTANQQIHAEKADTRPAWERENREPTRKELLGLPQEQLVALMQKKAQQ